MADNNSVVQSGGSSISISPQLVKEEGAGKAYQSVAQSMAIAIQDATDNLRNLNTISATAIGVSMAQYLETGDEKYQTAIQLAQSIATGAAENFQNIGSNAATVLNGFPSGS